MERPRKKRPTEIPTTAPDYAKHSFKKTPKKETKPINKAAAEAIEFIEQMDTQEARDAIASFALQGLIATRAQHRIDMIADQAGEICATAYIIADHMLKVRGFKTSELQDFLRKKAAEKT